MSRLVTTSYKRAHAVTGDLVTLAHPTEGLDEPFSSHVDITFQGVTHQILTLRSRAGIDFTHTTDEFTVGGLRGFVLQAIDTVATQGAHRHQAVVDSADGALTTYSYLDTADLLAMVGALQPVPTALGMVIAPNDAIEIVTVAKVAMATAYGLLECSPLTSEVNDLLPDWTGTQVSHGELFGGHLADDAPYLTLVTGTARALLMVDSPSKVDAAAAFMSELEVRWEA